MRRPVASRPEVQLPRISAQQGHERIEVVDLDAVWVDDDYLWRIGNYRDRHQVGLDVVVELGVEARRDRMVDGADEERVAIGSCLCRDRCADRAAGATPAVND